MLTTEGMRDVCEIGDQSRPRLFDLNIRKPEVLFLEVIELDERVTIEDYDLNPAPAAYVEGADPDVFLTSSGEVIRVLKKLNIETTKTHLQRLRKEGYTSVAVALMHSHVFPGETFER